MESIASTISSTAPRASGDNDPVIPKIPGPRQPSDRSAADRAAFEAASYVRPHPASITAAAANTMRLRTVGDRNPTEWDFDANNQLVAKAGAR